MSTAFLLGLLFVSESDANVLLAHKARRLRVERGNLALHSESEERDVSVAAIAHKYLLVSKMNEQKIAVWCLSLAESTSCSNAGVVLDIF